MSKTKAATLPIPDVPPNGDIKELDFMEFVRRALNAPGRNSRVFRQNSGSVVTRNRAGKATGRFQAGAPVGAADLSGLATVEIAGLKLAVRLECEIKVDHEHTPEQVTYGEMITKLGGVYLVCRYDHSLTLAANVARAVEQVDAAIAARVAPR